MHQITSPLLANNITLSLECTLEQLLAIHTGSEMQIEHDEGVSLTQENSKICSLLPSSNSSSSSFSELTLHYETTSISKYAKILKVPSWICVLLCKGLGSVLLCWFHSSEEGGEPLDWIWWPETAQKHNVLSAAQNEFSKEVKRLEKDGLVWNIKVLFSVTKLSFWQKREKVG